LALLLKAGACNIQRAIQHLMRPLGSRRPQIASIGGKMRVNRVNWLLMAQWDGRSST
jgi:hypothetical protein